MSLEVTRPVSDLRALAHPVRLQILSLLTGSEMSAAELARELDISQANASYHLRQLAAAGYVVEAGEEKIRGGVAKRYRHPWEAERGATRIELPSAADHRVYLESLMQELARRHTHVLPGRGHMTDAELWVTSEVWDEVLSQVRQASELIHAEARPPRSPGTVHVNLSMVAFRMQEEQDQGRAHDPDRADGG